MTVAEHSDVFLTERCAASEHTRCRGWQRGRVCGCGCQHPAANNVRAAGAVVLHAQDGNGTPLVDRQPGTLGAVDLDDARHLLDVLGLVDGNDGHEVLPDEVRHGRLLNEAGHPVAVTSPVRMPAPAKPAKPAKTRGGGSGRKPIPIEHGTEHGYQQHKRKGVAIPDDDSCGCQAAHEAQLQRPRRKPTAQVPDPLTGAPDTTPIDEWPEPPAVPTPEEIRDQVDGMAPRVHEDGSINAQYVAIEQTLRSRHGHPSYIASLDGPGKFRPKPVSAPPETPTEGAVPAPPDADAAGTAPDPPGPGHGNAGPDAQPQVSPSRSHAGEGGGLGASDAPAEPTATVPADPTIAATAGALPVDVDEWLAAAQRSASRVVQRRAATALLLLLQLRCALDDLARAERSTTA